MSSRRLLLLAALAAGGCAPSARLAAPNTQVPVLVGPPPAAGERLRLEVGRRPPVRRDADLPDVDVAAPPDDEERLRAQLRDVMRSCPGCAVYLPWIDARLQWIVLLGEETSALRSNAAVVDPEAAP